MAFVRFLFKVSIVYFEEKIRFNSKNNYKYSKLANFLSNIIDKIDCKIQIVISYTLLGLRLKKIQAV